MIRKHQRKKVKTLSSTLFLVVVSMFVVSAVMAQDMASLRRKSEETVKTTKPEWKLITKQERGKHITYQWGDEKAYLTLMIFHGSSEQEAAEKLREFLDFVISVGPDKKLTGYGDEAYLWVTKGKGYAAIRFRKANVFFDVSGTSQALVEDLAKKLANHVKK